MRDDYAAADSADAGPGVAHTGHADLDYVLAVYALNGVEFRTSANELDVVGLYRAIQQQGTVYHASRPVVGDLVFYHNTEDRNHDGRNNDWYTHVGIVESVRDDGTIYFLHYFDGQVRRSMLNLETASTTEGARPQTNTPLRVRRSSDPEYTQYLSGDLFAGFGSVLGDRAEFYVLDDWSPEPRSDAHASAQP